MEEETQIPEIMPATTAGPGETIEEEEFENEETES